MNSAILNLFEENETDLLVVSDFDIMFNGTRVDCIVKSEGNGRTSIEIWAGNPETDKHADQLRPDTEEMNRILNEVVENF